MSTTPRHGKVADFFDTANAGLNHSVPPFWGRSMNFLSTQSWAIFFKASCLSPYIWKGLNPPLYYHARDIIFLRDIIPCVILLNPAEPLSKGSQPMPVPSYLYPQNMYLMHEYTLKKSKNGEFIANLVKMSCKMA